MNTILQLAVASALHRRVSLGLAMAIVLMCTFILASAERLSSAVKDGFYLSVSGTDLVVGARTTPINLLAFSVFHIGNPSNNMSWQSVQWLEAWPDRRFVIPISLGDSYRGQRVVGTTTALFEHFRYGDDRALGFAKGRAFKPGAEVVLGHDVARKHKLKLGAKIALSHGTGDTSISDHALMFEVVGILEATRTSVDRALFVDLSGLALVHQDLEQAKAQLAKPDTLEALQPQSVSAVYVGLNNRLAAFKRQRDINDYPEEALSAVLPTVTLAALWQLIGGVEQLIRALGIALIMVSLLALVAVNLSALRERSREFAVLRANGLNRWQMILMIEIEVVLSSFIAALIAIVASGLLLPLFSTSLGEASGVNFSEIGFSRSDLYILMGVSVMSALLGLLPALTAYRDQLNTGLTPKL